MVQTEDETANSEQADLACKVSYYFLQTPVAPVVAAQRWSKLRATARLAGLVGAAPIAALRTNVHHAVIELGVATVDPWRSTREAVPSSASRGMLRQLVACCRGQGACVGGTA